jgi:ATP-dependent RNA circularization protein (DNA/RNA ligase family)
MKKYPKILRLGHVDTSDLLEDKDDVICIQEKVDGANFRIYIGENKLTFGSRNNILGSDIETVPSMFSRASAYVDECISESSERNKYIGCTLVGECMVKHSINYNWDTTPAFIGYDVRNEDGEFLDAIEAKQIFESLGLPFIPIVYYGKISECDNINYIPTSQYYDGESEGIVIKNARNQIYAKIVTDAFKETHRKEMGASSRQSSINDNERFINRYCTDSRIEKQIFKLRDEEDVEIDMPMMMQLPSLVYQDIIEENWSDILNSNMSLEIRTIKKMVARQCAKHLKRMITYERN